MAVARREGIEFLQRAPVTFTAEFTLAASPERVFDAFADTPGWSKWFSAISKAEWTSPAQGGLGSTRRVVLPGGVSVEEEFVVWDRPHRWGFQITGGNLPFFRAGVEVAEFEPAPGGGTRLTYRGGIELVPAARLLGVPMAKTVPGLMRRAFAQLDRQLGPDQPT